MPQISLHSPIGDLSIAEHNDFIVSIEWGWGSLQEETTLLKEAKQQLNAYFDGKLRKFDLALQPFGTPYQLNIWKILQTIPYGETRSYQEIAKLAGGSPRSVGGANAKNPIPIIIPCHRVLSKNGLGGYSGGEGIKTKHYLLAMESFVNKNTE